MSKTNPEARQITPRYQVHGLALKGGEEVAQAGAVELDDLGRGLGTGPALEEDKGRDEVGRWGSGGEIEVHFDRDGVARGGGGEVGWEVDTEHGGGAENFRENAMREATLIP